MAFEVIIPADLGEEFVQFPATDPSKVRIRDATEAVDGVIQIATQAEVDAGTNDTKAVTPLKLGVITDAIDAAIAAETATRIANDNTLQTNINNEAAARAAADAAEAAARAAADAAEATARANADAAEVVARNAAIVAAINAHIAALHGAGGSVPASLSGWVINVQQSGSNPSVTLPAGPTAAGYWECRISDADNATPGSLGTGGGAVYASGGLENEMFGASPAGGSFTNPTAVNSGTSPSISVGAWWQDKT